MLENRNNSVACFFADTVKKCFCQKKDDCTISPLSKRGAPGRIKICKVTGDRKVCSRIAELGVYPGAEADIICPGKGKRCVLKVNGGTISLDADVSEIIFVASM